MDLDRVQVALRPRNHWEAVDLGVRMARRWAVPLYLGWALLTLPFLLLSLPPFSGVAAWVMFGLWWLKPLFERLPLLQVSRGVFGEELGLRDALRAWRAGLGRDALAVLTWRRFSPTRALDQPLAVLEGLSGKDRARRLALLHRTTSGTISLTLMVLLHLELVLLLALFGLLDLWVPEGVSLDVRSLVMNDGGSNWLVALGYWLVVWLLGPVHACCGFALYLNRRVELEGWDLEIGLRRLARRLAGVAPLLLTSLLLAMAVVPAPVSAQTSAPVATPEASGEPAPAVQPVALDDPAASRRLVAEVLARDEYHQRDERSALVWPELRSWWESLWQDGEDPDAPDDMPDMQWLVDLVMVLPAVLEFLLWVLVVSLVVWLLWHYRDWLLALAGREPRPPPPPEALFGLDVTPESLPDDLPGTVQGLLAGGDLRGALALLYRGALVSAMHGYDCRFRSSDTEAEVLVRARDRLPPEASQAFARLTHAWQQVAYGHRRLPEATVSAAAADWQRWFADAGAAAGGDPGHG